MEFWRCYLNSKWPTRSRLNNIFVAAKMQRLVVRHYSFLFLFRNNVEMCLQWLYVFVWAQKSYLLAHIWHLWTRDTEELGDIKFKYSFIHSFIHSIQFIHSFIHSFIQFIHSYTVMSIANVCLNYDFFMLLLRARDILCKNSRAYNFGRHQYRLALWYAVHFYEQLLNRLKYVWSQLNSQCHKRDWMVLSRPVVWPFNRPSTCFRNISLELYLSAYFSRITFKSSSPSTCFWNISLELLARLPAYFSHIISKGINVCPLA